MSEIHLPDPWKGWKIVEKAGEGSSGAVYKAQRKFQGKTFISAIKVIEVTPKEHKFGAVDPDGSKGTWEYYRDIMNSFTTEIELMDKLKGITNIVSIEDYYVEERRDGWSIYIRMEYLENLQQYASRKNLTEEDAVQVGIDICTALEACEKVHILHRDIKQDNIFVSALGYYKLGDFGIARKFERMSDLYSSKGTPSYMAPEIFHGEKYGSAADLYSLGIVLYRLMHRGRDPFVDADKQMIYYRDRNEAFQKRMSGEPLPPPVDASPEFAKIILRACRYRPQERYHNVSEMKESLQKLQKNNMSPEKTAPVVAEEKTQEKIKTKEKSIWPKALIVCLLVIVAGGLLFGLRSKKNIDHETENSAAITAAPAQIVKPKPTMIADNEEKTDTTEVTTAALPEVTATATPTATPVPSENYNTLTANKVEIQTEIPGSLEGENLPIDDEQSVEIGSGSISENNPTYEYQYIAPRSGNYCFHITNINEDSTVRMNIYDSYLNKVSTGRDKGETDRTVGLEENEKYKIEITQSDHDNTEFTLSVTPQTEIADISDKSSVTQQIIYKKQTNMYCFTPDAGGYYYFGLTDSTAKAVYRLNILDSHGKKLGNKRLSNLDGLGIELNANEEYTVQIIQNEGFGKYTLNIYRPKTIMDVSGYTKIKDKIEFPKQIINYTFVAPFNGYYNFSLSYLPVDVETECRLKYDENSKENISYVKGEGKAKNVSMTAGEKYTIQIKEHGGLGDFTINIIYPEDAQDYLRDFKDSLATEKSATSNDAVQTNSKQ